MKKRIKNIAKTLHGNFDVVNLLVKLIEYFHYKFFSF